MPPDQQSHRQLFWFLQAGGWLLLMLLSVGVTSLLFEDKATILLLGVFRQVLGFVLTLGLWRFYRRWPAAGFRFTAHLGAILSAMVVTTGLDLAFTEIARRALGAPELPAMAQMGSIFIRSVLYVAWTALYFGLRQEMESRSTARQLAEATAAHREAELQLLRARLSPGFFLNGLDTIIARAREGDMVAVVTTAQGVAGYLRHALSAGSHAQFAKLGAELDAMAGYLQVETARLGPDRIDWTIEAAKEARGTHAPTPLLHPLVENAIQHGLSSSARPLKLLITAEVTGDMLLVAVENSGTWTEPAQESAGGALEKLRRRLFLLYDRQAVLKISTPPGRVRVEVRLPLAGV